MYHEYETRYYFVDVDDTLVRHFGSKSMPIMKVINYVRNLKDQGCILYCWSAGGAEYAKRITENLKIDDCFEYFLPKPNVMIDDQTPIEWRYLKIIHPSEI